MSNTIASIANNNTVQRYFYTGANYCAANGLPTTLQIGSQTLILGTQSPDTPDRDLTIYPNTIYTFSITLK